MTPERCPRTAYRGTVTRQCILPEHHEGGCKFDWHSTPGSQAQEMPLDELPAFPEPKVIAHVEMRRAPSAGPMSAADMLNGIRSTLHARAEGRNEGGDVEVMKSVDDIVAHVTAPLRAENERLRQERRVAKIDLRHAANNRPIAEITLSDGTRWVEVEEYTLASVRVRELEQQLKWRSPFDFPEKDGDYLVKRKSGGYDVGSFHRSKQDKEVGYWHPAWEVEMWATITAPPEQAKEPK